jgi:hypothetical protein
MLCLAAEIKWILENAFPTFRKALLPTGGPASPSSGCTQPLQHVEYGIRLTDTFHWQSCQFVVFFQPLGSNSSFKGFVTIHITGVPMAFLCLH